MLISEVSLKLNTFNLDKLIKSKFRSVRQTKGFSFDEEIWSWIWIQENIQS